MFKRFLQIGGLVAVGTLAAAAIGSAAESQTEFNRDVRLADGRERAELDAH
jgi:hypothetical protein